MPKILDRCGLLPIGMTNRLRPVKSLIAVNGDPLVEIVYVYVANNESYRNLARAFVQSYVQNPPGCEHLTTIACNCGKASDEMQALFAKLPNVKYLIHDNSGYDIGAYQKAARASKADLMLFLTASTYFNGPGWLLRVKESFKKHGDALYGTMGNRGDPAVNVNRHIRSTAFWMTPSLFNQYPINVTTLSDRYEFEHRRNCLTEWVMQNGIGAWVVGRTGEYEWADWDRMPNGYRRGDQSNLMIGDHLTAPPHYPPQGTK